MNRLSPQETLARKEALGVSYPDLARRVGVSHVTVQRVLKEEESGIGINRKKVLLRVNAEMDAIEQERAEQEALQP